MNKKVLITLIVVLIVVVGLVIGLKSNLPLGNQETTGDNNSNKETIGNRNGDITATVEVNNTKLQFPCTIQDLKNAGFSLNLSDSEIDQQLKQGSKYVFTRITDMMLIGSGVYIVGEDINNCQVIGASLEKSDIESEKYSINGLKVGEATLQEAIDIFGQPTDPKEYDPNEYTLFLNFGNFDYKSFNGYELGMTFRQGTLIEFCYVEKER